MGGKKKKAKLIAVISLIGVLAVLAVVYAAATKNLLFKTSNAGVDPFNVVFKISSPNATSQVAGVTDGYKMGSMSLSNNNKTLTISGIEFNRSGTGQQYNVVMKNDGTVPAKLTSINVTKPSVSNVTVSVYVYLGSAGTSIPGSGLTTYVNGYTGTNSTTTLSTPKTLAAGQYIPFSVYIYESYTESSVTTSRSFGTISITPHWESA